MKKEPYKMVTREEVDAYLDATSWSKPVDYSAKLVDFITRLLDEREAYRKVAIQVAYEYGQAKHSKAKRQDFAPGVDAEALNLLSSKLGEKSK